jgi:hypothetical protein
MPRSRALFGTRTFRYRVPSPIRFSSALSAVLGILLLSPAGPGAAAMPSPAAGAAMRGGAASPGPSVSPGAVSGRIVDESTESPLAGAMVLVQGTELGASADSEGRYRIESVPPGIYNVRFVMMGYESRVVNNVVVNPGRTTERVVPMKPTMLRHEGVDVTAGYFHGAKDAVVSNRSMDYEEIRMDAGSAEDIQRVVQALPAVVSGGDQENEIIVRGGLYGENLFVMDDIEIPNPNHFGYQGAGGGPINMINNQFVRQADFYAGAFPARYGDKASSVLDITLRDGDRRKRTGHAYLGMSGAGLTVEGPIAGGRGSYILSGRKSYLDLIISSTGLTAVPHYYNLQGKATVDLDGNDQILVNGIYGNDRIRIAPGDEESGYDRGADDVVSKSRQYAVGATWKHLYGRSGFSRITLSRTENRWDQSAHFGGGKLYANLSTEAENALRAEWTLKASERIEFDFGGLVKSIPFHIDVHTDADTIYRYDVPANPALRIGVFMGYPPYDRDNDVRTGKAAAFGHVKWRPGARMTATFGLRGDYFDYTGRRAVDPRLGLSWALTGTANLNLALGRHSQSPSYLLVTSHPDNRRLDYKSTRQAVLGLEKLFREDVRGTVEVFYKDYRKVPIPVSSLNPDPYASNEGRCVNEGRGEARGVELFLQKKMRDRCHFTLSYSYSVSKGRDPRSGAAYDWDFDYRHVFSAIGGVRWDLRKKDWYRALNRRRLYRFTAWMLPFADQVELGVRWRVLGGRPYTEYTYVPEYRRWILDPATPRNGVRFPGYNRLDLRLDRRWMFNGWNLVTYLDVMNLLGRDNIWDYSYADDGTREKVLQYQTFPVGGVTLEF